MPRHASALWGTLDVSLVLGVGEGLVASVLRVFWGSNSPSLGLSHWGVKTIGKYVCPTTQQYVDNKYLGIVRNVETIKSTNVGQLTLDHLMASIWKFVNGGANLEGHLPLMQDKALIGRVLANLKEVASIKHLQCLTMTDGGEDDKWLCDEIMCHDHPNLNFPMLERDGKVENCHEAALAGSHGTTKGDNYLRHDLVFIPTNMANTHWFLMVVNPRRRGIHILDSLFSYVLKELIVAGLLVHSTC
ncbi:hypothetical protein D1007_07440 [Hordeum vulgare]|nr:hypothetical protein D1007_34325 [Hordeum vulgare]KAE8815119.1 hypothetical protein D1007_07440 [Hordeum vulgare]